MTVLVTAATGTTGRAVVHALLTAGQEVRALTRNPATADLPDGVEVVKGDLDRPDDLGAVLDGVDRVYYLPAGARDQQAVDRAEDFLALAVKSGLRRVVALTGSAITTRRPGSFELLLQVEQRIEASGLEWTHVRPHEFAVNKLDVWAHSVRTEGVVRNAFPDGTGVPVHEADIAEVAVVALLEDGHHGRAYTLTGPERLTHRQQAAAVAEGIGRPLRFEPLTFGQARRSYIEGGFPMEIAEYILCYQAEFAEEPPEVSPDFERVTGRPGRTLAEWARDHRADFE
ncbi:NAD(P)H-binding protein [Umezawaea endophytica]|uniref:NAD(P)H-binding protein n=1 Tax=Umezawaea endophytica TaxID=1654476 RepID=A0A9X2VGS4_9PSEU|nr:NAD(P)H-binding protein [Umezawaea endophytica]MCS7476172.1 NAD(P)H-binding protein [Umezawaea endophytica]